MATRKAPARKRRLGKGLGGLVSTPVIVEIPPPSPKRPTSPPLAPAARPKTAATALMPAPKPADQPDGQIAMIPVIDIRPNARQPRQAIEVEQLESLAESIRTAGLMQPVVVRPSDTGDGYELIAGERRWRAALLNEMTTIPAVVRHVDDQTAGEWALIENIQREDLNALERAEAFRKLIDEFDLTHQHVADAVGLDRSTVTNHLRLLELDEPVRRAVSQGQLTLGHAKALLAIANLERRTLLAEACIRQQWSVRELERRARQDRALSSAPAGQPAPQARKASLRDLEQRLGEHLGTKVELHVGRKKGAGRLVIEFYSVDQFDGLIGHLGFDADKTH